MLDAETATVTESATEPRPISPARLRANRRNAGRSTGPKTPQGKQRSRMNAWVHGLRSDADHPAPDERVLVERLRPDWTKHYPAEDACGAWLVGQLILTAVRISKAQHLQMDVARRDAERAVDAWDLDRAAEVAVLARRLPKDPGATVATLRQTLAGTRWLLDRWHGLAAALDGEGTWGDPQREHMADLLGVAAESRAADLANLAAATTEALGELIDDAIGELEEREPYLKEHDRAEQLLAISGRPTTPGRDLRRLQAAENRLHRQHAAARAAHARSRGGGGSSGGTIGAVASVFAKAVREAAEREAAAAEVAATIAPAADRDRPRPAGPKAPATVAIAPKPAAGNPARPSLNRKSLRDLKRQARREAARNDRTAPDRTIEATCQNGSAPDGR